MKYEELTPELQEEINNLAKIIGDVLNIHDEPISRPEVQLELSMRELHEVCRKYALSETAKRIHTQGMMPCEMFDGPWPMKDVLDKLVHAADVLLHNKDYDGHGWEEIQVCWERGKAMLANWPSATLPPQGYISIEDSQNQFKALMHCGQYVDANLLEKGIYTCSKPFIYTKDETIESMIERGRMMKDMTGTGFIPERYFDNLKQCSLVPIFISQQTK